MNALLNPNQALVHNVTNSLILPDDKDLPRHKAHDITSTAEVCESCTIDTSDDDEESVTDFNCSENVLKTKNFSHSCQKQ
ncbi:hypothetical protein Smp_132880 [Schistosoma mansoni]|uniref:hypothetical protein n=1 Tax=Schistosoma mansoni TaxID=6183 RepID=UPI0001A645EF|nr:hypothetical protein Smp_132880 [Schistosoma mansoni]|eukprot:XP_018654699.1 hypothetical protein Smp_132880 [Schistosoma mansoni]